MLSYVEKWNTSSQHARFRNKILDYKAPELEILIDEHRYWFNNMHSDTCKMSVNNTEGSATGMKVIDSSLPQVTLLYAMLICQMPYSDWYFMSIIQVNLFY